MHLCGGIRDTRILIIDDERETSSSSDRSWTASGFHRVRSTTDPSEAASACARLRLVLIPRFLWVIEREWSV